MKPSFQELYDLLSQPGHEAAFNAAMKDDPAFLRFVAEADIQAIDTLLFGDAEPSAGA